MTSPKPFDALAYAISVLGQPHEIYKNRFIEASHGLVADAHLWELHCGRWLVVQEWDDGDQVTAGGAVGAAYLIAGRSNDDGSLCPRYEGQARGLIDEFYEAWRCND